MMSGSDIILWCQLAGRTVITDSARPWDHHLQWWCNLVTGQLVCVIKEQIWARLDAEDQLWCELAGITVITDSADQRSNPDRCPHVWWSWDPHTSQWIPSADIWEICHIGWCNTQ